MVLPASCPDRAATACATWRRTFRAPSSQAPVVSATMGTNTTPFWRQSSAVFRYRRLYGWRRRQRGEAARSASTAMDRGRSEPSGVPGAAGPGLRASPTRQPRYGHPLHRGRRRNSWRVMARRACQLSGGGRMPPYSAGAGCQPLEWKATTPAIAAVRGIGPCAPGRSGQWKSRYTRGRTDPAQLQPHQPPGPRGRQREKKNTTKKT